ncbi:MAG: GNAT family N-acetyltransferase [Rubrobacter sp.]|nr:GNAT family N-acetyltransferase [Rubrobacter sp.]
MTVISIQDVTHDNWRATLRLSVRPEQQRFVADSTPIVAIALAKAYVRPAGHRWIPYIIYADTSMVGFIELSYEPESPDQYWIYHFFIDRSYQGKGYGKQALRAFVEVVKERLPQCQVIRLAVHPENHHAQYFYTSLGFRRTDQELEGEPVYALVVR